VLKSVGIAENTCHFDWKNRSEAIKWMIESNQRFKIDIPDSSFFLSVRLLDLYMFKQ